MFQSLKTIATLTFKLHLLKVLLNWPLVSQHFHCTDRTLGIVGRERIHNAVRKQDLTRGRVGNLRVDINWDGSPVSSSVIVLICYDEINESSRSLPKENNYALQRLKVMRRKSTQYYNMARSLAVRRNKRGTHTIHARLLAA